MSCLVTSLSSQGAANFGNFLTGIAALTALFLTIWTAVRGIKIWKHQVIEKTKAEVAGRVAVAVIRLFQAMSHVTSPITYTAKDPEKENGPHKRTYQMRSDLEQRFKETS